MLGHGFFRIKKPSRPSSSGLPWLSTISATIPGIGSVPDPGFSGVAPGIGEINIAPVSVCHQVSTMGQRLPPITR